MSILPRNLYPQSNIKLHEYSLKTHLKSPKVSLFFKSKPLLNPSILQTRKSHLQNSSCFFHHSDKWTLRVKQDGVVGRGRASFGDFNFDAVLSILEFLSLASSVLVSLLYAANSCLSGWRKVVFGWLGERVLVWQCVVLVGGVAVGVVIRGRQWRRICNEDFTSPVNLLGRVEKLEENLKSSTTVIRILSRQLEKLGMRFRLFRKALKEPIAEAAGLAQKNSEATRVLAMQEDVLEKELAEIQKVLLAMQEQQQKQLELILAIATRRKAWEREQEQNRDQNVAEASKQPLDRGAVLEPNQIQTLAAQREANRD